MGRLLKGIDIREHGSKSVGATNVLRTLGKGPAYVVLMVDVLKGVAAIVLTRWLYTLHAITPPTGLDLQTWVPWAVCVAGLRRFVGAQPFAIWLNFAGGKSAAAGLGVLLAISWPVSLAAAMVFGVVLAASPDRFAWFDASGVDCGRSHLRPGSTSPYRLLVIAGGIYVIARHRADVPRLLAGTEPRLGQSSPGSKARI